MKNIAKMTIIWVLLFGGFYNCQDVTVGYLITEDASYTVDSLVIKHELDIEPPHEVPNPIYYDRIENWGMTPEELAARGIYPTKLEGGGEDYLRHKQNIPWVSTSIEGIDGTQPILISIKDIRALVGSATFDEIKQYVSVRGDGTFTIPLNHNIPVGRYLVSLAVSNEGYTKYIDDCFTIIVK